MLFVVFSHSYRTCVRIFAAFITISLHSVSVDAEPAKAPVEKALPALGWDKGKQGQFVMALLQDSRGDIWAATEDKGIWRYSASIAAANAVAAKAVTTDAMATTTPAAVKPNANAKPAAPPSPWTNYSLKDGLGDDTVYALAEDKLGRIWAGTLRNGVSVWNGKEWRNYGLLEGPLGERVFAIATCPSDGDVWMATNAGLSRYSLKSDSWKYYTRAEGLPADQIQAIAFDSLGNLYAGTQCDGLVLGKSDDNYAKWQVSLGPDLKPGTKEKMPLSPAGEGLPISQINDILVADDDTVYVATPCGLARSRDFGQSWSFLRGVDWEDKVKRLRHKPTPVPPAGNLGRELLREDYVTNLAEDQKGLLFLGYRVKGYEIRRPLTDRVPYVSAKEAADRFAYVSTVLPTREGPTLLANYGDGLTLAVETPVFALSTEEQQELANRRGWKAVTPPKGVPALPSPAKVPTMVELNGLLLKVQAAGSPLVPGQGYYEGDDWRTWGDWVGRYGSRYAVLCASGAPLNHYVINDPSYKVEGFMGPGFPKNSLRHWIHQKKWDNPRVLYNPRLGYRRQAEWDDNAETMAMSFEGPDVWVKVTVPAGTHRLSIYNFNKDGHWGNNRMRDYLLELKQGAAKDAGEAEMLPTQARARMRDFWGPVYKRFVVQGPGTFWLKVGKNHSFNAILAAVFLDKLEGPPTKYENRRDIWLAGVPFSYDGITGPAIKLRRQQRKALAHLVNTAPDAKTAGDKTTANSKASTKASTPAVQLWEALDSSYDLAAGTPLQGPGRILALRAQSAEGWGGVKPSIAQRERGATPELQAQLYRWRRQGALWAANDRADYQQAVEAGWKSALQRFPDLETRER